MMPPSTTHLVLIPSYNTGPQLIETVRGALAMWSPVWVVIDGSTDGSADKLRALHGTAGQLRVFVLAANRGKGAAIMRGLEAAEADGFDHVLTMDADGQHPAASIGTFMAASALAPLSMILGRPVFDESAPSLRVRGRLISNWWSNLETLGGGIADSLCGFRVYPVAPLLAIMRRTRWMRRFDFDTEAAVRLYWRGVKPINLPAPVRYLTAQQGGVSHFRYGRDNALLTWMHVRLMLGFLWRLPLWRWLVP